MFQNSIVLLGQYRPLDSFLHRLDARAKILPITLVLVLSLLTSSFLFNIACLAALLVSLLLSGIGTPTIIRNFKPILLLVGITALYHLIFSGKNSPVLVDLYLFNLTEGGLRMAGFFSLRLILFVSIAFLMTLTNSPSELADAFVKLGKPLERLRVPVADLGLILFIAIRFIPILYEEFTAIKNAQIMRGVSFTGPFLNRIRKTSAITVPVFVAAIQRADELAMAIEARGYRAGNRRTFYSRSKFERQEWLFTLGVSAGLVGIFILFR